MPEHTIPKSLVENIQNGKAAIVVGANIGVPSWKQLLERMNTELRARNEEGDEAAAKDVDKLLHKGNLVRAAAFLGRRLGSDVCDKVVRETWASIDELPEVAKALAKIPVKQVWTTFPGDVLERAIKEELPEDWPLPSVLTYKEAAGADGRQRTLLKVLGDFESFVATPKSLRKALSSATELREFVKPYYAEGSLLFVGFRYGDPDLSALLDRVFGAFEPTESEHYLLAAGVGPVSVDELESDHHIQVLNLPGKGLDEEASDALLGKLAQLAEDCEKLELTLAKGAPDADDLAGWIEILTEDAFDKEAIAAVEAIEAKAAEAGDHERHAEVLLARIEVEAEAENRASLLRQLADLYENKIEDKEGAFAAITAAYREHPEDKDTLKRAEALAEETGGWAELVAEVGAVASETEDKAAAAEIYTCLGRWYHRKLDHVDYSVASYREALRKDPAQVEAYLGLSDAYRAQKSWAELADLLEDQLAYSESADVKLDLYLAIGDLCESQLAATPRAIDAYENAIELDTDVEDAFVALERLFRHSEHWGKLTKVLEQKASYLDERGQGALAEGIRREISSMRADKMGDLEGALRKHEEALEKDAGDIEALRALVDLYDKLGRSDDYLSAMTKLSEVADDEERPALLRQLAMELEEKEGGEAQAIAALEQLVELDPSAKDAYRSLERLHRSQENWDGLVDALALHAKAEKSDSQQAGIYLQIAEVYEQELNDPHNAITALESVLEGSPDNQEAKAALARLYRRTESYKEAADMYASLAESQESAGGANWSIAGSISYEKLGDSDTARKYLEKALELSPSNLEALEILARLHASDGAWESATHRLTDAADACANRLQKVDFLMQAAKICDEKLSDRKRATSLLQHVLEVDPENLDAGQELASRLVAAKRAKEALPVLEMVARRLDPDDRVARIERCIELGQICVELGEFEKAQQYLGQATELDRTNLEAALAQCDAYFKDAEKQDTEEAWQEVDKRYRSMLARHRNGLADSHVVDLWHRLGVAAQRMGDPAKAEGAFRRALERDSGHAETLEALSAMAEEKGDWKTVVATKRDMLDHLDTTQRASALERIGDIALSELKDPETALGAYLEATGLRPEDRGLLHKTLDVLTQQKQWRQAVNVLDSLSASETTAKRRAKFHYAAAVICRDELKDVDLAVDFFQRALDDDPNTNKAFDAIDRLLSSKGDWKALARAHRKMLKSIGEDGHEDLQLRVWGRLGDICADHLADVEGATTALEVALTLDPSDVVRREKLVDLYLESEEDKSSEIIEAVQHLIAAQPDRPELYRVLGEQYRARGEADKAYCVAQALVFLKAANDEEKKVYEAGRPVGFTAAKRRMTEELWEKAVIHRQEDRRVNAIFASIIGPVAGKSAQPASSFNFQGKAVGAESKEPISKVFQYATSILGLTPSPSLVVEPENEAGLRVANTVEGGKLRPTLVAGSTHAKLGSEAQLAFELGKRMAYFRPERYLNYALQSLPKLEGAFYGALDAAGKPVKGHEDAEMSKDIKAAIPGAVLDQVKAVASKIDIGEKNGVVSEWRSATDLTANRVGLILCNDLVVAARSIATEQGSQSTLTAKERLRDLLAYSVSEEYFAVRQHLGLAVAK